MLAEINGLTIAYDTCGDYSLPPIFLVHGFGDCRLNMEAMAHSLSHYRYVIYYDCRGHGQSTRPDFYTLVDHGRDLLALIDYFGYEKSDVLGYSMGSYIAGQAACLRDQSIGKLILLCTKTYDVGGRGSSIADYFYSRGMNINGSYTPDEMREIIDGAVWSPHTPKEKRETVARYLSSLRQDPRYVRMTKADREKAVDSLKGFDLRKAYGAMMCHTLILSAQDDGFNPCERGYEAHTLIKNSEYVEIQQAAHNVIYEVPEIVIGEIIRFLQKK